MQQLEKYLNDHLSGSMAAVGLLKNLSEDHPEDREFYDSLREDIKDNRSTLMGLIAKAGFERSEIMETVGKAAAFVGQWRLKWHGLTPGKLGLVEALEVLELGVQGQLLLWRGLGEISPHIAGWQEIDFGRLAQSAEEQKAKVEARRIKSVIRAFRAEE